MIACAATSLLTCSGNLVSEPSLLEPYSLTIARRHRFFFESETYMLQDDNLSCVFAGLHFARRRSTVTPNAWVERPENSRRDDALSRK